MKIRRELGDWLSGLREEVGDPSLAVCQLFLRYQAEGILRDTDELVATYRDGHLELWLEERACIPVALNLSGPEVRFGALEAFGIDPICPGVWALNPSLNAPGCLHGFVVLYDVPSPAPWEIDQPSRGIHLVIGGAGL